MTGLTSLTEQVHRDLECALLSVVLKVIRYRPLHFRNSGARVLLREFHPYVYRFRRLEGTVTTPFETLAAVNAFTVAHLITSWKER